MNEVVGQDVTPHTLDRPDHAIWRTERANSTCKGARPGGEKQGVVVYAIKKVSTYAPSLSCGRIEDGSGLAGRVVHPNRDEVDVDTPFLQRLAHVLVKPSHYGFLSSRLVIKCVACVITQKNRVSQPTFNSLGDGWQRCSEQGHVVR